MTGRCWRARRGAVPPLLRFLMMMLAVAWPLAVTAQQESRALIDFDIPAQPLPTALDSFSRQSGLQVSADAGQFGGHYSREVHGSLAIQEALNQLLGGTGLLWYIADGKTVVVEAGPAAGDAMVLDPIKVQGRASAEDKPYTTAGSAAYISRKEIERFRGTSVGDMFKGTTGVLVAENRNSGGLNINIRGMQGQGRVPVLVDGARQETTVYRGYAGVTSRSYVDPDLIGGVEIDKGPTMTAGGTGAIGGLVNMRTIDADDIAKPGNSYGLRLRGSLIGNNSGSPADLGTQAGYNVGGLGTPGHYRTDCQPGSTLCDGNNSLDNAYPTAKTMGRPGSGDFEGHAGSLAMTWRLAGADLVAAYAQRRQGNYYAGEHGPTPTLDLSERYDRGFYTEIRPRVDGASRIRGGEEVVNTHFESESTLLKTRLYPSDDHILEFSWLRYDSEYGELMPSELLWLGRIKQTEASEVTANTYTGRYQWQPLSSDWLDLDLHLWHTDTESRNNSYSEEMLELLGGGRPGTEIYRRWGGDLTNTTSLPRFGDLQVRYGVAWQREEVKPKDENAGEAFAMRDGERQETSAFLAMKWTFVPTLTLDAGIRHTRYSSDDNRPVEVNDPDSPHCVDGNGDGACDSLFNDFSGSGSAPMVSLLWEPLSGLQFYGKYAEALRMPSLFETTAGFSVAAVPGQRIKPERAKNREVGMNILKDDLFTAGDALRFKLAYFENRTEDYLTRTIPNTWDDTSIGSNGLLFRMQNLESVEFHGLELSLEYDLGWAYAELGGTRYNNIELCHEGSYRRQRCTDYGVANSYINNMIPPNWQANATLGFRLLNRTLEVGARNTWMGARNRVPEYNDQTQGRFATPIPWHQYSILDAFLTWSPNDTFSLDFNVDNVTDQYYLDALSLGMVPAPGRTARLGFTLQY
ncbi:TonB-dependent receptor [Alcanivorax sp. 24]|uniref:TonB-dependent receptor n=1 Tax=Alcanivorax sp. 24 TaxID=2545266 RepID=UPI00105B959F|nr:TonB-dependent receptor [Alcanivorax sp. 24]